MVEVEVVTRALQQAYGPEGELKDWAAHEAARNPNLAGRYASLLLSEGVLPSTDNANGFVFFSPSANQGMFEFGIARQFDASLSGGYNKPPQFIIADILGHE